MGVWSRRRRPINANECRSSRPRVIWTGSPPPLQVDSVQEALHVEGGGATEHVVGRAPETGGEDAERLALAVLGAETADEPLARGILLRKSTAASLKAHLRWALPILAPDVPVTLPADAFWLFTRRA